jgi:hypothetical protein
MHPIIFQLEAFLNACQRREKAIPEELIEAFGEACKAAMRKQFNDPPRTFRVSISNMGKPACQLSHEAMGTPAEPKPWYFHNQMLFGDLVEAATMVLLRAAGVDVTAEQQHGTLKLPSGREINGTLDLTVGDETLYDVKSASSWSFDNKFSKGFLAVAESDTFGYVAQGYGYAEASGHKFGGWIVTNKSTGEITVCEAPDDPAIKANALAVADKALDAVESGKIVERCFTDQPEFFYKKATGNRVLDHTCTFCEFKWTCWPELQLAENPSSQAKSKPLKYYTYLQKE